MQTIPDFKKLYDDIPKQPSTPEPEYVSPANQELMDKVLTHLNNKPQIVPEIK